MKKVQEVEQVVKQNYGLELLLPSALYCSSPYALLLGFARLVAMVHWLECSGISELLYIKILSPLKSHRPILGSKVH